MARLNGVKTLDMVNGDVTKVEYNGEVYAKADGKAQAGDIAVLKNGHRVIGGEVGAFYEVYIDGDGDAIIPTAAGGLIDHVVSKNQGALFRKASVKPYRLVTDRGPKAGDFVKFAIDGMGVVKGKLYELTEMDGEITFKDDDGDNRVAPLGAATKYAPGREFYEQVDARDTLTHEGVEYTLVNRKAQPGDVVVPTETNSRYFTNGKAYGPVSEELRVIDNEGDELNVYFRPNNRTVDNMKVYEPVAKAQALAEKDTALRVGDYAKVIHDQSTSGGDPISFSKAVGDIVKIVGVDRSNIPFNVERLKDGETAWARPWALVKATDEEVAAAKRKLDPRSQFAKGDKVRLLNGGGSHPLCGFKDGKVYEVVDPTTENHRGLMVAIKGEATGYALPEQIEKLSAEESHKASFQVGDYARVTTDNYEHKVGHIVRINGNKPSTGSSFDFGVDEITLGRDGYIAAQNIEKLSAVEVAKLEAEQAEKERWTEIGRKPNEFKKGDIVITTEDDIYKEGTIAEVGEVDCPQSSFRIIASGNQYRNWTGNYGVKLITPVEARFDRQ